MSKRIVTAIVAVVVIAGAAAAVSAKRRELRSLPPPDRTPLPVQVAVVSTGSASDVISTTALVRAETAATVGAQIGGAILDVGVREGDRVRAGQVVARIDARALDDAVDAARARLTAADRALRVQEAVFNRDSVLHDGGAISRQAFDASSAQLEAARAAMITAERALHTARVQRGYANVIAPYSGVITARMVEPGDLATPGRPLLAIERPGTVRVISKLAQDSLRRIQPGSDVTFSWEGQSMHARVSRIYPALDANALGSVETILPAPLFSLPNGASVHAAYVAIPSGGLTVPNDALLDTLDSTLVVRVRDDRADPVPVRIVAGGERQSVIEGAVVAGDVVVIGLPSELMALTKGTPLARRLAAPSPRSAGQGEFAPGGSS